MTPDAHMVETLRLRTAALHRVSRSNDLLRRENDDLRARLADSEKALTSLANDLLALCDDAWLRRRDVYMGLADWRYPNDNGASATEFCAHGVRVALGKRGYGSEGHAGYLGWLRSGRPDTRSKPALDGTQ